MKVVQHGIETRKGLIVIVGEAGSGKTLFLKSLVRALEHKTRTIVAQDPRADLDVILRLLIERLELHGPVDDRTARLERLTAHLITEREAGRIVCLLIDEAQDLEASTLDELRLLANLEFDGDALLPLVLVGQPELNAKLDHPTATRIKQRVALTRSIYPLIRKEVEPYINTRLKISGYENSGLFDTEAIDAIAAHSGGIPRMVNSICDNSLFRAYTMKQRVISAAIVDQVARELRISAPVSFQKGFGRFGVELTPKNAVQSFTDEEQKRSVFFDLEKQRLDVRHGNFEFHTLGMPGDISEPDSLIKTPDAMQSSQRLPLVHGLNHFPQKLLSATTGWCIFGGAMALSLLALNVNSPQLAEIYSVLSGKSRAPIADISASGSQQEQPAENGRSERSLAVPAKSEGTGTEPNGLSTAIGEPKREITANDISGKSNSSPAQAISPLAPSPSDNGFPRTQPAESPPNKKPAAVTLDVVKRSKVRAKPNDESEIIAELEPGNRVTLLAKSRDYYHVRSLDDKSIRGYVHREDAFFEGKNTR